MQKLAYLYGWQTFFEECDDVDDETLYEMAVLLGVMMGVGSANSMLTVIAKNAQEAVAKKVARQSLTKTSWYPILKKLLSFMGIKITKQTVGNAAGKVVVGVGGVISGAITFMGLSKGWRACVGSLSACRRQTSGFLALGTMKRMRPRLPRRGLT